MHSNAVALDSSVLIEHLRVKRKDTSMLSRLTLAFDELCVSPLVLYEILVGQTESRLIDTGMIFENLTFLPMEEKVIAKAATIYQTLRKENKIIDHFDILIAATAIAHEIPLATLNRRHFERIDGLKLFDNTKNHVNPY